MLSIRAASPEDAPILKTLIEELAEYERLSDSVIVTEEDLRRDAFGAQPKFRALIAEWDSQPAGYAVFFPVYSTFQGRGALFLEDLFVRNSFRGKGIGKALLARVAKIASEESCKSVHWEVLDWNQSAIDFYKSLGAKFREGWRSVFISDEPFKKLAEKSR
jgi:GNAT superfamily N-acetyltransferase